jgi:hypothetical protein
MAVPTRFSLFKRDNCIYYVSYFLDSKRLWRSTGTRYKSEALSYLAEFRDHNKARPTSIKLSAFTNEFLKSAHITTVCFTRCARAVTERRYKGKKPMRYLCKETKYVIKHTNTLMLGCACFPHHEMTNFQLV